jgi:predicted permease
MPPGPTAHALAALLPVFGLVALGIWLKHRRILDGADSDSLDRFVYYVALPAQLMVSVAATDIRTHFDGRALLATAVAYAIGLAGGWFASSRLAAPQRGALLNGVARANGAFVGLPVVHLYALGLPDGQGAALDTAYIVLLAGMVPCFNVGAVVGFLLPAHGLSPRGILHTLAALPRNPIILGSLAGMGLSLIQPGLLHGSVPGTILDLIAATAVPLALVLTGSHLDLATIRAERGLLTLATLAKLIALPTLTWGLCVAMGVQGPALAAAVLLMACPTAMASVAMARILGADHRLMAALIAASTVAAPPLLLGWLLVLAHWG